jgi:hypothetical protein
VVLALRDEPPHQNVLFGPGRGAGGLEFLAVLEKGVEAGIERLYLFPSLLSIFFEGYQTEIAALAGIGALMSGEVALEGRQPPYFVLLGDFEKAFVGGGCFVVGRDIRQHLMPHFYRLNRRRPLIRLPKLHRRPRRAARHLLLLIHREMSVEPIHLQKILLVGPIIIITNISQ